MSNSATITRIRSKRRPIDRAALESGAVDLRGVTDGREFPPVHPGEILRLDFLEPLDVTAYRLAKDIKVPLNRITAILAGQRAVSADTALRLARYFGTSAKFWLSLQEAFDLAIAGGISKKAIRGITPLVERRLSA
jgi:addiction module HigA family antidote